MIFYLDTDHPLAVNSPDYIYPRGTAENNHSNPRFNARLIELLDGKASTLDLGCAGGGFVKSMIDDGQVAVGLEGSDYSKLLGRAEWATIPANLFTCDIAKPFTLHAGNNAPYPFDVVTAWDVIEHIAEPDLAQVFDNVRRHLRAGGLFIVSTVNTSDRRKGLEFHQTRHDRRWWQATVKAAGFSLRPSLRNRFASDEWVRKSKYMFVFQKVQDAG